MKNENTGTGLEDKVDRYLLGYMDAEERSAFESEMSSDAGLKEEVSVRSMVIYRKGPGSGKGFWA